ncbi:MAG: PLDc N-terminal domain-containing protein, partial [Bacteroidales bacterium]|nr:PLDc N-terminal domain-containing protein [Bacteroidales bacterium]
MISFVFTRAFIFSFLIVLQIFIFFLLTADIFNFNNSIYFLSLVFNIIVILYLISTIDHPIYKLAWILLIFIIPPSGALIYL